MPNTVQNPSSVPTLSSPPAANQSSGAAKSHLSIRPRSGWQALNLREVWRFRDLLWTLGARDVTLRYRQTALGIVWVVLQPLLAAAITAFIFSTVAKLPTLGLPPIVFAYAGMLGWSAFSSTLTRSSGVLISNSQLISKVFFPRLVLPLSTIFSTLIDFGVALGMMIVLMLAYRVAPGIGILTMPLWLFLIILLATGLGLFTSALSVSYRDVQYIIPVATQFLFYATPVAYALSAAVSHVPARFQWLYFALNPLASLIEAFRWSLLGRGELHATQLIYAAAVAVLVFLGGAATFKKMERKFADVI